MAFKTEQLKEFISQMIRPLRNRVYSMITRAIIESVKDGDGMQVVKINLLAGETREDIEHFQSYGFTSHPPSKAECIALAVGGNKDHLVVIVADDRATRPTGLAKGESAQYNGVTGNTLKMLNSGDLEAILTAGLDFTLGAAGKVKFTNGIDEYTDILQ